MKLIDVKDLDTAIRIHEATWGQEEEKARVRMMDRVLDAGSLHGFPGIADEEMKAAQRRAEERFLEELRIRMPHVHEALTREVAPC